MWSSNSIVLWFLLYTVFPIYQKGTVETRKQWNKHPLLTYFYDQNSLITNNFLKITDIIIYVP